jgi:hypothetical protein
MPTGNNNGMNNNGNNNNDPNMNNPNAMAIEPLNTSGISNNNMDIDGNVNSNALANPLDILSVPPKALETDGAKRLATARARVISEMNASRKSAESMSNLDRRFQTHEIDEHLKVAANNILTAFLHIKKWVAQHIGLYAHAFLIKPLQNFLAEEMNKLEIEEDLHGGNELWREHAAQLDNIEQQQAKITDALDIMLIQQRQIMRRSDSFAL